MIFRGYEFTSTIVSTDQNETPDAFCSIVRVVCKHDPNAGYLKLAEAWPLVEALLGWIRVKGRHYWLLQGEAGFVLCIVVLTCDKKGIGPHTSEFCQLRSDLEDFERAHGWPDAAAFGVPPQGVVVDGFLLRVTDGIGFSTSASCRSHYCGKPMRRTKSA